MFGNGQKNSWTQEIGFEFLKVRCEKLNFVDPVFQLEVDPTAVIVSVNPVATLSFYPGYRR